MDTSALIAALVADHEHHSICRPYLSVDLHLPAIVAESLAQLRRTFGQPAGTASAVLQPWTSRPDHILPTTSATAVKIFGRAVELDLAGSIHDAIIAQVCADHDVPIVILDGRQHRLALAIGARSTYLLA